jgi:acyl-coenzyme A thioesterase 9
MVCRSAVTHKASKVNPLVVTTPEEKALYAMGEGLHVHRLFVILCLSSEMVNSVQGAASVAFGTLARPCTPQLGGSCRPA